MAHDSRPCTLSEAMSVYWRAGWRGILPLPPGSKYPPPAGTTGHDGQDPSPDQLSAWARRRAGGLALRMPVDVIGLDLDLYKGEGEASWRRLTGTLGPLPPTWRSSARSDHSGIRLYRVPPGVAWAERQAGPGIEIVHRHHRYAVVWPSVHPTGARYRWHTPAGDPTELVPPVDQLPELPDTWRQALTERPPPPPRGVITGVGAAAGYPRALLDGVAADLARLLPGERRDDALYLAALRCGRLIGAGRLDEREVTDVLLSAATACGHVAKHGTRRALRTVASGVAAGRREATR